MIYTAEVIWMVRPIALDILILHESLGQRSHPLVIPCTIASGFHLAQYVANHYSQMNDCGSTSPNFCITPHSLPESYSCQPSTPYMLSTISYYNGVSDLHRHECMEGQLDRTSSKDSPSSNVGIDLVLEKQKDLIVGLVIEDVFVLPSEFQAKSTSD
jgi:hypothetical protein